MTEPPIYLWPGWDTILAGPRPRRPRRLASAISSLLLFGGTILMLCAPLIGCWPLIEQTVNAMNQAKEAESVIAGNFPVKQSDKQELKSAREYNKRLLASGQHVLGETVDPFSGEVSGDFSGSDDTDYMSQLDDDQGVMAVIEIPSIGVNLPIRHGSDADTLEHGAGHLHGTSLPVGGKGTNSVITAHRGLRDKLMFTRLDELGEGDLIYIQVEGKTLAYRVDRTSVIEPDDTSQLKAVAGEDRITLMTCTPYGVNTHRLLVSGVRSSMPFEAPYLEDAPKDRWAGVPLGLSVGGLLTCVGCLGVVVLKRRRKMFNAPPMHSSI